MKVYFISGLGANSKCFKFISLPKEYEKICIEWIIPKGDETLYEYAYKMSENINTSEPFILVGYSFGGIIVQEMNKFLSPQKTILIASMKNNKQIPPLFKLVNKIKFVKWFPMSFFSSQGFLSYLFFRNVYFRMRMIKLKQQIKIEEYISVVDPIYLKWSINKIVTWRFDNQINNIYQIHGTKDIIFPFKYIKNSYIEDDHKYLKIIDASHILVLEKPKQVNIALKEILLDS